MILQRSASGIAAFYQIRDANITSQVHPKLSNYLHSGKLFSFRKYTSSVSFPDQQSELMLRCTIFWIHLSGNAMSGSPEVQLMLTLILRT
jgi:hypothetical protein